MSFTPFVFVVLAAFIHASWNLLQKRAAHAGPPFVLAYTLVATVAYAPWAVWLLLGGGMRWTAPAIGCILASGALHLAYSLCLQRGYQVANLSVVYPVARGTGPMLSSLGAFLLLGEPATAQGILGLVTIITGIGLITTQGNLTAFRQPDGLAGMRWGLTTGTMIAGYTVVDGIAVKSLGVHAVVLDWGTNLLRLVFLAPFVLRDPADARRRMKGHWRHAVAVGLLSPLSYILVLLALDMGAPLSVVAPTREMSMMVGALFGMLILREPVGFWRLAGCGVLISGVILLGRA